MCDPITMSAVSAGMSYGGTYLAGSSVAGVASIGTSLVNTASLFNYGSSYGKLGGALSSSAAGLGTSVASALGGLSTSSALSTGLSLMQYNAERTRAGYEIAQARYQQQQYKEEIERQRLEEIQKANERKRRYMSEFSSNRAIAAASGIDIASASYQALFKSNKETYLKDRDALRMSSLDEIVRSRQNLQLAKMKEAGAKRSGTLSGLQALGTGLLKTKQILDEE
jgi:hypothetical protein